MEGPNRSLDKKRQFKHDIDRYGTLQEHIQHVDNRQSSVYFECGHTNLMSWKTGACTTAGFLIRKSVWHNDETINKTDGMMEKNSCSNCMLKSNRSRFSWNRSCSPVEKDILAWSTRLDAFSIRAAFADLCLLKVQILLPRLKRCGRHPSPRRYSGIQGWWDEHEALQGTVVGSRKLQHDAIS